MTKRIAVGLSGGVDSSVTALLLKEQGFDVQAIFMKNWEDDDREGYCHAADDLADAKSVALRLGCPLHKRNFAEAYREQVFSHFLGELRAGRTPNPDVLCNRAIKFGHLLDVALSLGAEALATGHYARVEVRDGRYRLLKGVDEAKDQSYFLYALGQDQLAHVAFPLGMLKKAQVRRMAQRAGLVTFDKKDSTGICFIGERDFASFLARYIPMDPGPITTPEGKLLGSHKGLAFYTLGQRKGLGLSGGPWYVAQKIMEENRLVVVRGHDHPLLMSRRLEAGALHWVAGESPKTPLRVEAKTRYRQPARPCTLTLEGGRGWVAFDEPQWAVTPGQSVVFYRGEECLGGGVIEATYG